MKLIVGLGNPLKEYEKTRHNTGFMVIDNILSFLNLKLNKEKFGGIYISTIINDEKVIFLKPQNFINLSGEVIKKFVDYFKIDIANILIIHDDLDLEVGNYKLKECGGSGGHNGLKNIESQLGTKEYKRLKIGISNNKNIDTRDYVLGKFSKEEQKKINDVLMMTKEIILDYLKLDFSNLMNKYNKKNSDD